MNNRVFVLTVKNELCPKAQIALWEKIVKDNSIPNELIATEKNSVLQENILKCSFHVEEDTFNVFVVACLKETDPNDPELNKKKTKYLVEIINQIMSNENVSENDELKNFYLIAHEKDFNESSPDIFARKLPDNNPEKSYELLNKLIAEKHVYLFQHDLRICKIYSYLRDLTVFGKKEACTVILEIVGENREMIDYFQTVDVNAANKYTT